MFHLLLAAAWNLFLAALPVALGYGLASLLQRRGSLRGVSLLGCGLLAGAWLFFLPNAPYLMTEWRHLLFDEHWAHLRDAGSSDHGAMLRMAEWGLAFFLYSAAGVLCFVLSIRPLERWLRGAGRSPLPFAPALFFLTSLGVYLGLIVRLNTWDMLARPDRVWTAAVEALANPTLLAAVTVFAAILWAVYAALALWMDALTARLRHSRRPARQPL